MFWIYIREDEGWDSNVGGRLELDWMGSVGSVGIRDKRGRFGNVAYFSGRMEYMWERC